MEANDNKYSAKCPGCGKAFVFTILYPETVFKQDYKCRQCNTIATIGEFVNAANAMPATPPSTPKPQVPEPPKRTPPPVPAQEKSDLDTEIATPPPVPKQSPKKDDDDGKTIIATPKLAVLIDDEGNEYQLQEGRNTIGRKADSSTATIQIPTKDRSMSRNHIAITAVPKPSGGYKYTICNTENKFGTYINDSELEKGRYISLLNGDKIRLSRTVLTFKC